MKIPSDIRTLIVHDNCADGLLSGLLLREVFPNATLRFIQYQTPDHQNLKAEPGMLFADFSPPESRAQEFVNAGAYILDHHRSARQVVDSFGSRGIFGDESRDPGVSGAVLVFRELWKPWIDSLGFVVRTEQVTKVADIVTLAGIRDTWQNKSPRWEDALLQHAVFMFYPKEWWLARTFYVLDWKGQSAVSEWDTRLHEIGPVLIDKNQKGVKKTVEGARRFLSKKGTRVVVFDGVRRSSDSAELLGSGADLVVGFGYHEEDTPSGRLTKMTVSTRSHTTFDCIKLASTRGGGGHTRAAGFSITVDVERDPNPYRMIEDIVNAYESR